jgi:hypothetical protein
MRQAQRLLFALLAALFFTGYGSAQENAEITGTVTDSTGAVVPEASVTVILAQTGASRTASSNSSGIFDFPGPAVNSRIHSTRSMIAALAVLIAVTFSLPTIFMIFPSSGSGVLVRSVL